MKNQKGITLIALIITILVMLILAAVTINFVIGEDGVLSKAQTAASKMSLAEVKEKAELIKTDLLMEVQIGDNNESIVLRQEYMERLGEEFGVSYKPEDDGNKITVSDGKYDIFVKNSKLDLEVKEHTEYKDPIFLYTNISGNATDATGTLNLSVEIKGNYSDVLEYVNEKINNSNIEDDEKEAEVLEYISLESGQEINSIDEFIIITLNNNNDEGITHNTLGEWLSDPIVLGLFGKTEGSVEIEKLYYYYYHQYILGDEEIDGTMTEKEVIDNIYALLNGELIAEEYEKSIKKLTVSVGKENYTNKNAGDTITTMLFDNGKHIIKVTNSDGEEIYSEIIYINNLTTKSSLVVPENGDWTTELYNGKPYIASYNGNESEVTLPIKIGDNYVTSVGTNVFGDNKENITKIIIPEGIHDFHMGAFSGCTNLKEVVFPSTVTATGTSMFSGCTSLEKIVIPETITSIGHGSFIDCTGLEEIVIPDTVETINQDAFNGCTKLTKITIPSSIDTLYYGLFQNCTSLKEITIPNSIKNIQGQVFYGCTALEKIVIPESVTSVGDNCFAQCTSLVDVTLPNSISEISTGMFFGCSSLKEIEIPDSITYIDENSFWSCTSLEEFIIPNSVTAMGDNLHFIFHNCTNLKTITFKAGPNSIPEGYEIAWKAPNATVIDENNLEGNS